MKEDRIEFGFHRTVAASPNDCLCCQHIPGYLVPNDLQRLARHFGVNPFEVAKKYLLASPGAVVMQDGRVFRIPTLVMARDSRTGHCVFYKNGLCEIHSEAPFGCAYFDYDMPDAEADPRAAAGLNAVAHEWQNGDPSGYCLLWEILHKSGRRAPSPEESREALSAASAAAKL